MSNEQLPEVHSQEGQNWGGAGGGSGYAAGFEGWQGVKTAAPPQVAKGLMCEGYEGAAGLCGPVVSSQLEICVTNS